VLYKQDWKEVKKIYETWWDKKLNYPLLEITSRKKGARDIDFSGWEFLKYKCCPEKAIDIFEEWCENRYFAAESFPNLWMNLGPGSLAAYCTGFLGFDEKTRTAWFEKPMPWDEVEKLELKEDNEWWRYTKYITEISSKRGKDKFIVGTTDIGGILDVLSSFRGAQNLLIDLIEAPDKVLNMSDKILKDWFYVYEELNNIINKYQEGTSAWMGIWCHKKWYPLQCDFSAMISPKMFETFVKPYLIEQCKFLDYTIYHLDGPGQIPHLDILLDIPELTGIQWVPGAGNPQCDSPKYFPMYRKILDKDKLLILNSFDNLDNIPAMLQEIGFKNILISAGLNDEDETEMFVKKIKETY